ncbi:MAG: hypothetical protein FWB74_09955 [Defluviitaleaceae bacterium]|nr:hypothetical protein [Defluviitaleaceae bacterium]
MKKIIHLICALILTIVLVACGGNSNDLEDCCSPDYEEIATTPVFEFPSPAELPAQTILEGHGLFSGEALNLPVLGTQIFAGLGRSFAVDADNVAWAWGGVHGREPVIFMEGVAAVSSIARGDQFIMNDGALMMVGEYSWTNQPPFAYSQIPVTWMQDVVLSVGSFGALTREGVFYRWGFGFGFRDFTNPLTIYIQEELVRESYRPFRTFSGVRYASIDSFALTAVISYAGNLHFWGDDTANVQFWNRAFLPYDEPIMANVSRVSMGDRHSLILTESGRLYTFGLNNHGQIGNGTTANVTNEPIFIMDNVVYISAGSDNSFAITRDGRLYGWGRNNGGKLGDGTTTLRQEPVLIMNNVNTVSAGDSHTMAVTTDGRLYTWGTNMAGQLGDGTTQASHEPQFVMDNILAR